MTGRDLTTVGYVAPAVRCECGHNQARHELPGFDGECVAELCRCTLYRPVTPATPTAPDVPAKPAAMPKARTVEQLVDVARGTGDKRALLVIGRIQALTDELRALVAAHYARARDGEYQRLLKALPAPAKAHRPSVVYGEYPCAAPGCGHVAATAQGRAAHRRAVHEQSIVTCDVCGQEVKRTGLGRHRASAHPAARSAS